MISIFILLSFVLSTVMADVAHGRCAYGQPQTEPVVLEDMGPSSIVQPPSGFPAGWTLRQKQYLLRNLSSQDIVFYALAYVNVRGTYVGEMFHASYPPEHPALVAAGASKIITDRYVDNAGKLKESAQIDCVVFADGSSYGPNALQKKEYYISRVECRYIQAADTLGILETKGPEVLREILRNRLSQPNPLLPPETASQMEAARKKLGIEKKK